MICPTPSDYLHMKEFPFYTAHPCLTIEISKNRGRCNKKSAFVVWSFLFIINGLESNTFLEDFILWFYVCGICMQWVQSETKLLWLYLSSFFVTSDRIKIQVVNQLEFLMSFWLHPIYEWLSSTELYMKLIWK